LTKQVRANDTRIMDITLGHDRISNLARSAFVL
jgi:hypothetical protein